MNITVSENKTQRKPRTEEELRLALEQWRISKKGTAASESKKNGNVFQSKAWDVNAKKDGRVKKSEDSNSRFKERSKVKAAVASRNEDLKENRDEDLKENVKRSCGNDCDVAASKIANETNVPEKETTKVTSKAVHFSEPEKNVEERNQVKKAEQDKPCEIASDGKESTEIVSDVVVFNGDAEGETTTSDYVVLKENVSSLQCDAVVESDQFVPKDLYDELNACRYDSSNEGQKCDQTECGHSSITLNQIVEYSQVCFLQAGAFVQIAALRY